MWIKPDAFKYALEMGAVFCGYCTPVAEMRPQAEYVAVNWIFRPLRMDAACRSDCLFKYRGSTGPWKLRMAIGVPI